MEENRIDNDKALQQVLYKEIDLVQSCINRMASNSFEIKKWTLGIIAVLAGLIKQDCTTQNARISLLFLMVIFIFWGLDAFFLKTERLYRKKYAWIIKERLNKNRDFLFDLNPYEKKMMLDSEKDIPCILSVMFSKTLWPFYLGLAFFVLLAFENISIEQIVAFFSCFIKFECNN